LLGINFECQAAERYRFHIPAMNAAAALDKLADTSGYSLIYPFDDSVMVVANPLVGIYSVEDALTKLLLYTPLTAVATEKRVIVVSSLLSNYKNSLEYFDSAIFIKKQLEQQMSYILKEPVSIVANLSGDDFPNTAQSNEKNKHGVNEAERIQIIGSRRINRSPTKD
jgi:iron complex outermembrane receptor protein